MNRPLSFLVRVSLGLAVLVALLAFFARAATAQTVPAAPLTIGDAARLAARQSAGAEAASLRAEQATTRVRQRRADLLPNLSAAASQSARTFNTASLGIDLPSAPGQPPLFDPNGQVEGPVSTTDFRGHVSQTVLDVSAIQRVRGAQAQARASSAEAENASEIAATSAASSYVRVLRSNAQLEARIADSLLASELLSIARDQLSAGVGVALDVTRAQSQLAAVRAQLIASRNDRDRARLELLRTLNLPLDTPLDLADSLAVTATEPALTEADAIQIAMRGRPDVRVLEQQLVAAHQLVSAVRAERLPSIGAFGDEGITGKSPGHLLPTYNVGIQLSLPVFDGLRREARIEEQTLVSRELEVRRRDLRQQVAVEVRSAMLDLSSAREQVAATRERLRFAEQEVEQARERFRAGVSGNADVITAQLSLNAARTQLIDALTAYQSARIAFAHAEGAVTELP